MTCAGEASSVFPGTVPGFARRPLPRPRTDLNALPPVALDRVSPQTLHGSPSFTAPQVGPGGDKLVFRLVVGDGPGSSASDDVAVTVLNVNYPPAFLRPFRYHTFRRCSKPCR